MNKKLKVAISGSGNIETDLMIKTLLNAKHLKITVMVDIDPVACVKRNLISLCVTDCIQ